MAEQGDAKDFEEKNRHSYMKKQKKGNECSRGNS